jgi:hypothetical protein
MPTTTNRTFWPTTGGAVAFQPGWFQGHATAFIYINLGFGNDGPDLNHKLAGPPNMSNPMINPFQIIGPTKNPYPGTVCLPQVPLPVNATVKAGDNATIQVVELAVHGAALYSVRPPPPHSPPSPHETRRKAPNIFLPLQQCVDITFADPGDPRIPIVNETNCFNSTDIGVADIYTLTLRASGQGAVNASSAAVPSFTLRGSPTVYVGYAAVLLTGLLALL